MRRRGAADVDLEQGVDLRVRDVGLVLRQLQRLPRQDPVHNLNTTIMFFLTRYESMTKTISSSSKF